MGRVRNARTHAAVNVATLLTRGEAVHDDVRVWYSDEKQFQAIASQLGLMPDLKAGEPRGAYEGVLSVPRGPGDGALFIIPRSIAGSFNITLDAPTQAAA